MSNSRIEDILADYQRTQNKPSVLTNLILATIGVLSTVPAALLRGWVIHLYWGWFITLVFGVASPGTLVCTALYFMWNLPKGVVYKSNDEWENAKNSDGAENFKLTFANVVLSVMYSLSAAFFGWILHLLTS